MTYNDTIKDIAGVWRADNGEIWQFDEIISPNTIASLSIIADTNPPLENRHEYEILWENDENIFLDILRKNLPGRIRYQIWLTPKSLKIDLSKYNPIPNQQYLLLYKPS